MGEGNPDVGGRERKIQDLITLRNPEMSFSERRAYAGGLPSSFTNNSKMPSRTNCWKPLSPTMISRMADTARADVPLVYHLRQTR